MAEVVDYSEFVTLLRDQSDWGGCGGMATLHVFDIQMERLALYTPDGSFAFNSYVYNDSTGRHGTYSDPPIFKHQTHIKRDPRVNKFKLDQMGVIREYGCCPESTFPTNYDPPGRQGFPNEPIPADEAFQHALKYRIHAYSVKQTPSTIEELKKLLKEKGPLVFAHHPDGNKKLGHVVALIGYNDNNNMIKYINSANVADGFGGIQEKNYDYFLARLNDLSPGQGISWMTVKNIYPDIYTARIRIQHLLGRKFITVRIGIEGSAPLIVWDRNCHSRMRDSMTNLTIDVALPHYAASNWPPEATGNWYLEITDISPLPFRSRLLNPNVTGYLEDVELVKRNFHNDSMFTFESFESTSPSKPNLPIPFRGTLKVYIPSKKEKEHLVTVDQTIINKGETVIFEGVLRWHIMYADSIGEYLQGPQGINVELNLITSFDSIDGVVMDKTLVATTITNDKGKFTITYKPNKSGRYILSAKEWDDSNVVEVLIRKSFQKPKSPHFPNF